ncbi:hypothetical protein GCM10010503_39740 [Streptomyces lucensis JCM 4490]|uniref:Uncharacterized protein n=1 Tax=Streptomyces lucensis JCM 4490 TaxID=1306176 RepID=A0A918J862_9ACTN|nr:hypothetical protein GCM10010503_39740 [Streptomyces lucensis JCM 4490]
MDAPVMFDTARGIEEGVDHLMGQPAPRGLHPRGWRERTPDASCNAGAVVTVTNCRLRAVYRRNSV